MNYRKNLLLSLGCAALLAGCASYPAEVVAAPPPPPTAQVEVVPVSPGPGFYWVSGHWFWRYHRYVWVPGHYVAQRVGAVWVRGHYAFGPSGYVWVEGHWQ